MNFGVGDVTSKLFL